MEDRILLRVAAPGSLESGTPVWLPERLGAEASTRLVDAAVREGVAGRLYQRLKTGLRIERLAEPARGNHRPHAVDGEEIPAAVAKKGALPRWPSLALLTAGNHVRRFEFALESMFPMIPCKMFFLRRLKKVNSVQHSGMAPSPTALLFELLDQLLHVLRHGRFELHRLTGVRV